MLMQEMLGMLGKQIASSVLVSLEIRMFLVYTFSEAQVGFT